MRCLSAIGPPPSPRLRPVSEHATRGGGSAGARPQMSVTLSYAVCLVKPAHRDNPGRCAGLDAAGLPPGGGAAPEGPSAGGKPRCTPPEVPCTSAVPAHNGPPPDGEASDRHVRDRACARRDPAGHLPSLSPLVPFWVRIGNCRTNPGTPSEAVDDLLRGRQRAGGVSDGRRGSGRRRGRGGERGRGGRRARSSPRWPPGRWPRLPPLPARPP